MGVANSDRLLSLVKFMDEVEGPGVDGINEPIGRDPSDGVVVELWSAEAALMLEEPSERMPVPVTPRPPWRSSLKGIQ